MNVISRRIKVSPICIEQAVAHVELGHASSAAQSCSGGGLPYGEEAALELCGSDARLPAGLFSPTPSGAPSHYRCGLRGSIGNLDGRRDPIEQAVAGTVVGSEFYASRKEDGGGLPNGEEEVRPTPGSDAQKRTGLSSPNPSGTSSLTCGGLGRPRSSMDRCRDPIEQAVDQLSIGCASGSARNGAVDGLHNGEEAARVVIAGRSRPCRSWPFLANLVYSLTTVAP